MAKIISYRGVCRLLYALAPLAPLNDLLTGAAFLRSIDFLQLLIAKTMVLALLSLNNRGLWIFGILFATFDG